MHVNPSKKAKISMIRFDIQITYLSNKMVRDTQIP